MADRERVGRDASPTAAIIDSQSAKTTEAGGPRGYDAGKKINGRKRHALVDTDGRGLVLEPHPASIQDRDCGAPLLRVSRRIFPFIERVFADSGYAGEKVARARGQAVLRSSRHRRPGQLPVRRGPRRLKTQKDQTKGKRTMSLEDIDECLRWMKEGRAVRIRWQSGCTLWTRFDNQTGRPVADAENVFLGDGSFPLRRHGTDIVQDQSPISVVLENLLAPKT